VDKVELKAVMRCSVLPHTITTTVTALSLLDSIFPFSNTKKYRQNTKEIQITGKRKYRF